MKSKIYALLATVAFGGLSATANAVIVSATDIWSHGTAAGKTLSSHGAFHFDFNLSGELRNNIDAESGFTLIQNGLGAANRAWTLARLSIDFYDADSSNERVDIDIYGYRNSQWSWFGLDDFGLDNYNVSTNAGLLHKSWELTADDRDALDRYGWGAILISGSTGNIGVRRVAFEVQYEDGIPATAVPEPATLALATLGLAGMGFVTRRRRTK